MLERLIESPRDRATQLRESCTKVQYAALGICGALLVSAAAGEYWMLAHAVLPGAVGVLVGAFKPKRSDCW
jgi:hypothetical protein